MTVANVLVDLGPLEATVDITEAADITVLIDGQTGSTGATGATGPAGPEGTIHLGDIVDNMISDDAEIGLTKIDFGATGLELAGTETDLQARQAIGVVVGVDVAGQGAFAAEILRASTAESTIAGVVSGEITRALAADATNASGLAAEISRATTAEGIVATNLGTETTRATAAEAALAASVAGGTATALQKAANLSDVPNKVTARTNLGLAIGTNIPSLVALTDEVTRATAAEITIAGTVTAEAATARAAETLLTTNLAGEATTARTAESGLAAAISAEASTARSAEGTLTANLAAEISTARGAEAATAGALATETSIARAAETTLTTNLASEVITARAAESAKLAKGSNLADLTNKATARTNLGVAIGTDVASQSDLDDEVARAMAAEAAFAASDGAAVTAEHDRAVAAEDAIAADLVTEITESRSIEGWLVTNLSAEITRASAAEETVALQTLAETTRATAAENLKLAKAANLSDLANAGTARTNLGVAIGTDIPSLAALTAETARATAAEGAISTTLGSVYANVPAGLEATPGLTWAADLNTGLWSPAPDSLAVSTGGVERQRWDAAGTTVANQLLLADGTAANPGAGFASEPGLGLRRTAAGTVGLSYAGATIFKLSGPTNWLQLTGGQGGIEYMRPDEVTAEWLTYRTGVGASALFIRDMVNLRQHATFTAGATAALALTTLNSRVTVTDQLYVADGIVNNPGITWNADSDTGLWRPAADTLALSTGGVERMRWDSTAATLATGQLFVPDGTVALPGYSFTADPDTGMYRLGTNNLGLATGGAVRLTVSSAGTTTSVPLFLPAGTAAAPPLAFTAETGLGLWRSGATQIDLVSGGNTNFRFAGSSSLFTIFGDAAAMRFSRADGVTDWQLYRSAAAGTPGPFFIRDGVNGRQHITLTQGATDVLATTAFASTLLIPDGTIAAPVVAFTSEPGLGLYRAGAGQIAMAGGGLKGIAFNALAASGGSMAITGSGAGVQLNRSDGTPEWLAYRSGGGSAVSPYFVRDLINSRMQMTLTAGASDAAASTAFNSVLWVPDGTAANPSLAFSSDPTTGIWRAAAGVLALSTAGVERMRISAAVGVQIPTFLNLIQGGSQVQFNPTGGLRNYVMHVGVPGNFDGHFRFYGGSSTLAAPLWWTTNGVDFNVANLIPVGQIQAAVGTTAAPPIAFAAETGLGFFRSGASVIDVMAGGVPAFRLAAGATLGLLSAFGDSSGLRLNRADGTSEWQLYRAAAGASALYVRDQINSRMTAFFTAGASAAASKFNVDAWTRIGDATAPTSVLQVAGPVATAVTAVTATYTVLDTDSTIMADATSGAFTVTLPTPVGKTGRRYTVKRLNSGANAVTVSCTQLIDGVSTIALNAANEAVVVVSDNTTWRIEGATPSTALIRPAQLLLPDGTAAAPALSFVSQPGMGIRRSSADTIQMLTGSAFPFVFNLTNAALSMYGSQAGLELRRPDLTSEWLAYRSGSGASALYFRDVINARMTMSLWAGATAAASKALFDSWVKIGDAVNPTSALQVAGPIATAVTAVTATYTVLDTDSVITADATTAGFTVTLPTPVGKTGRRYTVKRLNSGANAVTVACAQLLDGAASIVLNNRYDTLVLVSDNATWQVEVGKPAVVNALVAARSGVLVAEVAGTTKTARWYNRSGRTMTITAAYAAVDTASTVTDIAVALWKNGSASGAITVPVVAGATTGATTGQSLTVLDGDYLQGWPTAVGSGVAGTDLSLTVVGTS